MYSLPLSPSPSRYIRATTQTLLSTDKKMHTHIGKYTMHTPIHVHIYLTYILTLQEEQDIHYVSVEANFRTTNLRLKIGELSLVARGKFQRQDIHRLSYKKTNLITKKCVHVGKHSVHSSIHIHCYVRRFRC